MARKTPVGHEATLSSPLGKHSLSFIQVKKRPLTSVTGLASIYPRQNALIKGAFHKSQQLYFLTLLIFNRIAGANRNNKTFTFACSTSWNDCIKELLRFFGCVAKLLQPTKNLRYITRRKFYNISIGT